MSKRSLFFAMIFSSLIGGFVAVVGYSYLVGPEVRIERVPSEGIQSPVSFTNFSFDTTDVSIPGGVNFVYAASTSTPSVVHIRTKYDGQYSTSRRSPFEELFRDYLPNQPRRRGGVPSAGSGSGVIIDAEGFIVTNNHVIDGASEIEVVLNDNRSYNAEVIGVDPTTDLAVIKIDAGRLQPVKWGQSDDVQIGEWVLAVGNPFEFRSTVTAGIVSAKARNINILSNRTPTGGDISIESFIQTDAAVNPGNSGGALVNLRGELVGINTAIASPTGAFAGYSFAVPVTLVKKVTEDLREFGTVQRALLGINIVSVSSELAEREGLSVLKGVYVGGVGSNSAAEDAGIEQGDVIVAIDGKQVDNVSELQEVVALNRPGDNIDVTFLRDGNRKRVKATLKNQSNNTGIVELATNYQQGGAVFVNISNDEKRRLDIDGGVKIKELGRGLWREAGVKEGFIITRIDKQNIEDLESFKDYVEASKISENGGEGMLIAGYNSDGERSYYGIGW